MVYDEIQWLVNKFICTYTGIPAPAPEWHMEGSAGNVIYQCVDL